MGDKVVVWKFANFFRCCDSYVFTNFPMASKNLPGNKRPFSNSEASEEGNILLTIQSHVENRPVVAVAEQ